MLIYEEGILNSVLTNEKSEIWVNITNKENNKIYLNATSIKTKIDKLKSKIPCDVGFRIDAKYLPATNIVDIFEKKVNLKSDNSLSKKNNQTLKHDDIIKCTCEIYLLMREGCKCGGL